MRKEEEGAVMLFDPFFGGGGGTVTAGSLFAAAAEVATENFFGSCFAGVLPGWHGIVGDNMCGKNRQV